MRGEEKFIKVGNSYIAKNNIIMFTPLVTFDEKRYYYELNINLAVAGNIINKTFIFNNEEELNSVVNNLYEAVC